MKLAVVDISGMYARLERLVPQRLPNRSALGYGLYTAALFAIFFLYTLPVDVIARRLVNRAAADSGWEIEFREVHLVPWDGFRFSDVALTPPRRPGDASVRLGRVSIRPSLSTFLGRGFRKARFHGDAYGGSFTGAVDWSASLAIDLGWGDLRLSTYPGLKSLVDGSWEGKLSGEIHLSAKDSPGAFGGGGRVGLKEASLTGGNVAGFKVPDLHFAGGEGDFEIKGGRLEIRNLKLSGREVDAELRGQLYLLNPVVQSVVNATLIVRPIPGGSTDIESSLRLLNGNRIPPNGIYTYSLYGVLNRLKIR